MKALAFHFGILITLLTVIWGLWQNYDYEYLIFKTIEVFILWIFAIFVLQNIVRMILINKENDDEEEAEEYVEAEVAVEQE